MSTPLRRLRLSLAGSARAQFWLLWAFFFCAETSSYLMGVLSSTLLVKRAGADKLPVAYLFLNCAFLPIVMMVLARPPSSSFKAVRISMLVYLVAALFTLPGAGSNQTPVLIALYVVARLGKLIWSTFAVGMVAEVLPLREAKASVPSLLAAGSSGIVVAGLVLKSALAFSGIFAAFAVLWIMLAAAYLILLALEAITARDPARPAAREAPLKPATGFAERLRGLLSEPLARVIAIQNLFVVGLRYFIEFVYAGALGSRFASESDMAGFAGTFEATLQITTTVVQLTLAGVLMRTLRVGGVCLLLPGLLLLSTTACVFDGSFAAVLACQFLFWIGSDGFNKPVRQVMLGALPPSRASSVPVLMAALGMSGSVAASALLVPLAWMGNPRLVMLCVLTLSALFLAVSLGVGRTYRLTLSRTLQSMDDSGRDRFLSGAGGDVAEGRFATIGAMLDSPDDSIRLRAVSEAALLGPMDGPSLLLPLVWREPDARVRSAVVSALAALRPDGLLDVLAGVLSDPDARVRANALDALADCREDSGSLDLARPHLSAEEPRERAAAIVAVLRAAVEPRALEAALDGLAEMITSDDPRARSAAVAAAGRLGYSFVVPRLELALRDPDAGVRGAAVDSLLRVQSPAARQALAEALSKEPVAEVASKMQDALLRLGDGGLALIREVSGYLTGPERALVGQMMAAGGQDRRMEVLGRAVQVSSRRLRTTLVELIHETRDAGMLAALGACLERAGSNETLALHPLVEHAGRCPGAAYEALHRVLQLTGADSLALPAAAAARRLWVLALVEEALETAGDAALRLAVTAKTAKLLEHLLACCAAATRKPDGSLDAMRAAMSDNRRVASLSLELLEQWLPASLRDILIPVLDCHARTIQRRQQARKLLGMPADAALDEGWIAAAIDSEELHA